MPIPFNHTLLLWRRHREYRGRPTARRLADGPRVALEDHLVPFDHGCAQTLPPAVELTADRLAVALDM